MGIFRDRPTPAGDNVFGGGGGRAGRYGEIYVSAFAGHKEFFFADEGSYRVAINPTAGTGILGHAAPTTFDETKPYLSVYNGGQNRIYPQFLRLYETVVSTAAVRVQWNLVIDNINRYSSGGTALTINNTNMDNTSTSGATIYAGAVTAAAASASRRLLGNYQVRGTIDVVEDVYEFVWGHIGSPTGNHSRVATVGSHGCTFPPVVIGPGQSMLLHQWSASQSTGPTLEVNFGFIER